MNWLVYSLSVIFLWLICVYASCTMWKVVFHISQRFVFLLSICILICLVHLALIFQLLSHSSPLNKSFSFLQTKLICKQKLQCPNNITHFSIHIDTYENISYIRSPIFARILETIRNSSYYTNDSSAACVHIAPVDTIDRDRRSKHGYYTYFIEQRLKFFPEWSDPNKIHLIFNHYTGTWPSYRRTLDFHLPLRYILASTSFTFQTYNCLSHLTFPLFHSDYPSNISISSSSSSSRSILLSFKGKSYKDVQHHRTFFRHLHNNRDIIIQYTDDQNTSSNQFEYIQLLQQSHFCLVPSGRRLYSYRFLEVLQYGCIPIITTNENESLILPFNEIIDWSKSVLIYSNFSISLLPYYLRMMKDNQRTNMQRECFNIWLKYFSSIERIVLTSLDILNARFMSSSSSFSIQP